MKNLAGKNLTWKRPSEFRPLGKRPSGEKSKRKRPAEKIPNTLKSGCLRVMFQIFSLRIINPFVEKIFQHTD